MMTKKSPKIIPDFTCNICNYKCSKKTDFDKHLITPKHLSCSSIDKKVAKVAASNMVSTATFSRTENDKKYYCENCDYTCSKFSDFKKHLSTRKHNLSNSSEKKLANFCCNICKKEYSSRQALHVHKKKCRVVTNEDEKLNYQELVLKVLKDNNEIKTMLGNVIEKSTTTYNTTNSFNLNVFLNEKCKDAMNLTEFVDSLSLQFKELESLGELGYVNGMSSIIMNNLNKLDVTQRPLHCTDSKREILYVKDENKWEKEQKEKPKMKEIIRKLSDKNIHLINDFHKKYPDCLDSTSVNYIKYNNLLIEMLGYNEKDLDKIIRKISKEVKII